MHIEEIVSLNISLIPFTFFSNQTRDEKSFPFPSLLFPQTNIALIGLSFAIRDTLFSQNHTINDRNPKFEQRSLSMRVPHLYG